MNIENITKLKGIIDLLLENESRINEAKPIRYWYPLSLATYGSDEIIEALDSMCAFRTSMAEKTQTFESRFASLQGCSDAVMVNSGSSADLLLALLLTNPLKPLVKPGDEVILPIVTWPTQIWSIMMAGLEPVFVDVDPRTLNMDMDDLEASITPRTRVLFPVHLMGNPCDMDRIQAIAKRHGLHIIEDCCEALGASWDGTRVGNFGLGGAFSFFFSHHITTMEGGMVTTRDPQAAEHLRMLRAHGWARNVEPSRYFSREQYDVDPRYAFVNWGLNVRPTEVQAGFGIRQLERLAAFDATRARHYARFKQYVDTTQGLLSLPFVPPKAVASGFALSIMLARDAPFTREQITSHLEAEGVETRPIVAGNLARQPVAAIFPKFASRTFPGADEIHERGFYVGLSPLQTDANLERLVGVFETFLAAPASRR